MKIEKTLLTCSTREFLIQTNKMKKSVEKWATLTDIKNIMKRKPNIESLTGNEERDAEIKERNKEESRKQGLVNLSEIMDEALEEHTDETLEIIALMHFMSVDELNQLQSREVLISLNTMLNDEAIIGFFTSLLQLEQTFLVK